MQFVWDSGELAHVCRLNEWLEGNMGANIIPFCLWKPFDSYFSIRDVEEYRFELDLEVSQQTKDRGFCVGWNNHECFAVPQARH